MPTLHNPILPGFFPDPSIILVGDTYYMANSTFTYFPCITISKSKDLQNWEIVGHAVTDPSYVDMSEYDAGRGFWAPDISYSNGKYYIVVTLRGNDGWELEHRQMIVYSDKPEGPYSKPVYIDEPGIDPALFHDDDGKHYMVMNPSVKIILLTDDCLSAAAPSRLLYEGWNKRKTEGPHIIKKDGWYYLFMAEGGTGDGHMITVARARNLTDEFEACPHNPLLTQTDPSAVLQRTGHGCPFMTKEGDWMIVYLCARKNGGKFSLLGRETAIAKLSWDEDGWPVINDGKGALTEIELPDNYMTPAKTFESVCFKPCEYNELPMDFLYSEGYALLRQRFIDNTTTLKLDLTQTGADECGVMYYYDFNCYVKLGAKSQGEKLKLSVTLYNKEERDEPVCIGEALLDTAPVCIELIIRTTVLKKEFLYKVSTDKTAAAPVHICTLENGQIFTDEGRTIGKRFTGPAYGIYGYAAHKPAFLELNHETL
ncbi:MAG: glycoside hydrolase family 43 protein [Lachnospiraceae bacterium]|nr:glycoside hydrolase family 43 protein [Lachnospiraceae bacterium]